MLWPHARIRHARNVELQERVAVARRTAPESEAWLRLLEAALGESEDGATWEAAVPPPAPAAKRPVKAPLLSHAEITVDGRAARGWVRRLLKLTPLNARRIDGLALLEAALCHDDARIDTLAAGGGAGGDPQALRVLGQMAALPLLQACGRRWARELPATWWEGYCPLCGAWPVVAEYTGLERTRRLRCGRCGIGWAIPLLRCVFCDETQHDHLGYLTPEAGDATRKIEVCHTCKGYVKAVTTVRALAPWAVLLDDLTTVPLDVAALERGYHRPPRPGYPLEASIGVRGPVGGWGRLVEVGGGLWRSLRSRLHHPPAPPPSSTDLRRGAA
jgi:FdhE protein